MTPFLVYQYSLEMSPNLSLDIKSGDLFGRAHEVNVALVHSKKLFLLNIILVVLSRTPDHRGGDRPPRIPR